MEDTISVPVGTADRLLEIKKEIASSSPYFKEKATKAWAEIIEELAKVTKDISTTGTEV